MWLLGNVSTVVACIGKQRGPVSHPLCLLVDVSASFLLPCFLFRSFSVFVLALVHATFLCASAWTLALPWTLTLPWTLALPCTLALLGTLVEVEEEEKISSSSFSSSFSSSSSSSPSGEEEKGLN